MRGGKPMRKRQEKIAMIKALTELIIAIASLITALVALLKQ